MKKLLIVTFTILFAATAAHAGQFGAPEPSAKDGKFAIGAGYFYSVAKWSSDDAGWTETKLTSNQPYVQASYGFMKDAEVYLRVGAMDLNASPAYASGTGLSGFKSEFSDGFKPSATLGFKGVFNITPEIGIGPFLQTTLYPNFKDSTTGKVLGAASTQEMELKNAREFNVGFALQGKIGDAIVYAGPVAYWARGDVENKITVTGGGVTTLSTAYKEKNNVGGFLGVRLPMGKEFAAEIEGQYKSDFSGGASVTYSF